MRLTTLVPEISQDIVNALADVGIRTDSHLLLFPSDFELWKQLPKGTVSLQKLRDLRRHVLLICSQEAISGKDLLDFELASDCKPLQLFLDDDTDKLPRFFSGLPVGSIVEISGDRGSGKTTLALNLAINALLLNQTRAAVWIDTQGDFPMDTMLQAVHSSEASTVLDRLQITRAFDVEALHDVITSISESEDKPHVLVIDAITPLFGPLLSPISSQGHALMTEFLRNLHTVGVESKSFILVINDTASKGLDRTDRKPALGPSFALMADTSLWLWKGSDEDPSGQRVHHFQVTKSRSMSSPQSIAFTIANGRLYRHETE